MIVMKYSSKVGVHLEQGRALRGFRQAEQSAVVVLGSNVVMHRVLDRFRSPQSNRPAFFSMDCPSQDAEVFSESEASPAADCQPLGTLEASASETRPAADCPLLEMLDPNLREIAPRVAHTLLKERPRKLVVDGVIVRGALNSLRARLPNTELCRQA